MSLSLDWSDVRYFLETARAGRFSGAARRLGVSHTTVARRVARLEEALRNRLLEPGAGGLIPTEAGAALIPLAERMETQACRVSCGRNPNWKSNWCRCLPRTSCGTARST
ncbi:LysR family transcriptional regulator [Mameliella alba]|uniref:LysR family transcriptional regulator n=1 Tax=Mameliella alba TaxID=561184 RepID=UPI0014310D60|nr:LysR family transcriptional regulator [Mameliella alba]